MQVSWPSKGYFEWALMTAYTLATLGGRDLFTVREWQIIFAFVVRRTSEGAFTPCN